jgi:hypothetical protein
MRKEFSLSLTIYVLLQSILYIYLKRLVPLQLLKCTTHLQLANGIQIRSQATKSAKSLHIRLLHTRTAVSIGNWAQIIHDSAWAYSQSHPGFVRRFHPPGQ